MSSNVFGKNMNSEEWNKSKIQRFYEGKTVLLTGGTGFLGKVLVEKLLRSCPNIRQIYLLVREKNGVDAEKRMQILLDDMVFSRLKNENTNFLERVSVVHGDLHRPKLGLSTAHETLLTQNVNVVLHSAATIRFNEGLKTAIMTNVAATKELCMLAQKMVNLKAFIYVSTAYSNCENDFIQEKVYPVSIPPDHLIGLSELLDEPVLNELTANLIGSKPNTYIFTKCAAEEVIYRFKTSLPVAILRPSIVVSTVSEPVPGWTDNGQGPTGAVAGVMAGLLHTIRCDVEVAANIVPVDFTANAIIALAYSIATHNWWCSETEDVPVVNLVSTAANSVTWGKFKHLLQTHLWQNPSQYLMWFPFVTTPRCHWSVTLHATILHHLPALVIDFLTASTNRPTRLRKLYRRLDKHCKAVNYFTTRHFNFEEKNALMLWECLEQRDRELFPFNMAEMDWNSYFSNYVLGCRQFLLHENPESVMRSRQRLKYLYLSHVCAKGALLLLAIRLLWFVLKLVGRRVNIDKLYLL